LYSLKHKVDGLISNQDTYYQTNTENTDSDSSVSIQTLQKAIKLLKDSIKTHSNQDQQVEKTDKKDTVSTNQHKSIDTHNNKGKKKEILDSKKEVIETKKTSKASGREEVAVPVYTELDKKSTEDKSTQQLVIELANQAKREEAGTLADILKRSFADSDSTFSLQHINDNKVTYQLVSRELSADSVATKLNSDNKFVKDVEDESGLRIVRASATPNKNSSGSEPSVLEETERSVLKGHITIFAAVVGACTLAVVVAAVAVCLIKRRNKEDGLFAFKKQEAVQDYQELCRTQMSVANARSDDEDEDNEQDKSNTMRHNWYDEQFPYNMDIGTGHVILDYMEDHLRNENRLNKEWEALCSYKADDAETTVGSDSKNTTKNRYRNVLPYDRTRVKLREVLNVFHCDYINANYITDVDPNHPDYIATQGPLDNTVADFWQMIWEQGVVVIVNLTKLSDMGLPQCHRYWPENGSEIFHIYEVHLISEHIWCDDYLVRSLYLKNLQTGETRTITQFHYLTWPDLSIPDSAKPLLEFRRKVNKCYRGQACPIIVHCNNGVGRTGTYILLDMVLNKMVKGAKEIDIAATLEHLRDQRPDMVKTKGQFEFSLTAMAEEVSAILSAAPK